MPPGWSARRRPAPSGPTVSSTFTTGRPISSCEPRGHPVHPERRVGRRVAGGPAEVADQDQAAAAIEDRRSSVGKCASDPAVVGDAAVGRLRHVEVDADQHLAAGHVEVADRLFGHGVPCEWSWRMRGPRASSGGRRTRAAESSFDAIPAW